MDGDTARLVEVTDEDAASLTFSGADTEEAQVRLSEVEVLVVLVNGKLLRHVQTCDHEVLRLVAVDLLGHDSLLPALGIRPINATIFVVKGDADSVREIVLDLSEKRVSEGEDVTNGGPGDVRPLTHLGVDARVDAHGADVVHRGEEQDRLLLLRDAGTVVHDVARPAGAGVAALSVAAELTAGAPHAALVHIHAGHVVGVHLVAGLTEALGSIRCHDASGVTGEGGAVAAPTPRPLVTLVPALVDVVAHVAGLQTHRAVQAGEQAAAELTSLRPVPLLAAQSLVLVRSVIAVGLAIAHPPKEKVLDYT